VLPHATLLTDAAQQAGRDALAAYRAMWTDWVAVAATSDYQNPRLIQHASGAASALIYKSVYLNKSHGVVTLGQPSFAPYVSAATPEENPNRVTIADCADDSKWLNYTTAGKLQDDVPGGRHFVQSLLLLESGIWKVDQLAIHPVGTC
jgi:hypothetical protein